MKIGQAKCIYCGYKTTTGGIIEHQKNCKMKPNAVEEMNKAVKCLYLELPEAIADDVRQKWEAAYEFLSHPEQGEQDEWPEGFSKPQWLADEEKKASEQGEQGEYRWTDELVKKYLNDEYGMDFGIDKTMAHFKEKNPCKLSSPPPEGQDELWKEVRNIIDEKDNDYFIDKYLLIKKYNYGKVYK